MARGRIFKRGKLWHVEVYSAKGVIVARDNCIVMSKSFAQADQVARAFTLTEHYGQTKFKDYDDIVRDIQFAGEL